MMYDKIYNEVSLEDNIFADCSKKHKLLPSTVRELGCNSMDRFYKSYTEAIE